MGARWSRMSWSDRSELWTRWRRGDTPRHAQALHRAPERHLRRGRAEGGIAPRSRRRSRLALTTTEREEISRQLALRSVVARHQPPTWSCAVDGQSRSGTKRRARRLSSGCRRRTSLAPQPATAALPAGDPADAPTYRGSKACAAMGAAADLRWLRCTFPSDPDMQVSPETIYRGLFVQSRGVLKRHLLQHLRRQQRFRHARTAARQRPRQGQILDAVSIRQRPGEVHDRAVPGHWEGDLLEGAQVRMWRRWSNANPAM